MTGSHGFRADLGLGLGNRGLAPPNEALAQRVQLVLSTRPGELPWEPEFGCDLRMLVGVPAGSAVKAIAEHTITGALRRWVPEAGLKSCNVHVKPLPSPGFQPVGPVEAALVPFGAQAALLVDLLIETADGDAAITLEVEP
jgi:hypothetical protein